MPWAITPNAASGPVCGPMNPILIGAPSANGWVASAGHLSVGTLNAAPAASVDGTDVAADDAAVAAAVVAAVVASVAGAAAVAGAAEPAVADEPELLSLPHAAAMAAKQTTAVTRSRVLIARCVIGTSPLLLVGQFRSHCRARCAIRRARRQRSEQSRTPAPPAGAAPSPRTWTESGGARERSRRA